MRTTYKNEQLMKFLTIIGALVGLFTIILGLANIGYYGYYGGVEVVNRVITAIVGLVIVILTFLCALRPSDPIPFHWLVLLILAILLVIFGAGIIACILVLIAGLIGLIEDL